MKKNDLANLKSKNEQELIDEVKQLKKDWLKSSSDFSLRKVKNVHEKDTIRKNIARSLTILRQKQIENMKQLIEKTLAEESK